uniref:Secreted protein n=1 Tax=Anguilla anguilla TaxID=7936 RepID=A0A0E9PZF6_ANGAN
MTEWSRSSIALFYSLILIPSAEVSRILVTSETFALGTEATVSLQRLVRRQKTDQSTATEGDRFRVVLGV